MEAAVDKAIAHGARRSALNPSAERHEDPVGRLLRIKEVCALVGLSRPTLYRCISRADLPFPKPVKIGACSRWSERQVIDWKKALMTE